MINVLPLSTTDIYILFVFKEKRIEIGWDKLTSHKTVINSESICRRLNGSIFGTTSESSI